LRLGIAADFLSNPAMLGFMNGAALVIIGSQIGKLCGIKLTEDNTLLCFWESIRRLGETHALTLAIGVACIAILALCRWKARWLPGAVVVFVLAMVAGQFVNFSALGLHVIGVVDLHIPDAVRPGLRIADTAPLFTAAIGIALLVFSGGPYLPGPSRTGIAMPSIPTGNWSHSERPTLQLDCCLVSLSVPAKLALCSMTPPVAAPRWSVYLPLRSPQHLSFCLRHGSQRFLQ
jgi:hypothetical protein